MANEILSTAPENRISDVGPAPAAATPVYPRNRAGWLHTFSSVLTRVEVAREIGLDATLLILAVAVQEDAQQYRAPLTLFFPELLRMLGIRSRDRLNRIRQKAIDAGWLVYVPGPLGDVAAARYWTVIPERLNFFVPEENEVLQGVEPGPKAGADVDRPAKPDCLAQAARGGDQTPQISDLSKSRDAGQTGVVAQILNSAAPDPVVSKNQNDTPSVMNPLTQLNNISRAYPVQGNWTRTFLAIQRALQKISYDELLAIVNRYAEARRRSQHLLGTTPQPECWFDAEGWKQDPATWDMPETA